MTPEQEMEMHERVKAHWIAIGLSEKSRRRRVMNESDKLEMEALRELRHCQRLYKAGAYGRDEADRALEYFNQCAAAAETAARDYYGE